MESQFSLPLGMGLAMAPNQRLEAKHATLDGFGDASSKLLSSVLFVVIAYIIYSRFWR